MNGPSIADQLVDAVISDYPDHKPGTRPVHTIGIGTVGYFEASDVARDFCTAEHFQGQRVPATVRFSNGSGSPVEHDGWSDARGMATRFHLKEGAATDLIAMTLNSFFAPTVQTFLDFSKGAQQQAVSRESPWRKILDMLKLELPLPDPLPGQTMSADAGTLVFADRHRYAQLAVFQAGSIGAPVSYARAAYHAVHTFVVTAPDGVRRYVRFHWQPIAGVRNTDPAAPPVDEFLHQELRDRLASQPAQFRLNMSIGEVGDDFNDPTRPWPERRARVFMGTLTLTAVPEDQSANCEKLGFNPCRLVPGIDVSDDPVLWARREAYNVSQSRRGATACPFAGSKAGA
jgi:catalase